MIAMSLAIVLGHAIGTCLVLAWIHPPIRIGALLSACMLALCILGVVFIDYYWKEKRK